MEMNEEDKPEMPRIRMLDPDVVNRIAAGEVIQRPCNAIKELIENCIDAKSTSIQIQIKEGGLKYISVNDNGTGIRKDDMEIVCERFTTSKIRSFDDLKHIETYGFRGEALASMSQVANVTIISKVADSPYAYKASYRGGKMLIPDPNVEEPRPCAGTNGTQIIIEDLFYNTVQRKKALQKHTNEEYNKIVDVVMKYALHNYNIAFNVKKVGESKSEVSTKKSTSRRDTVRTLYGGRLSKELIDLKWEDNHLLKCKANGLISNPSYIAKKTVFILFINNRLVNCSPFKKALELQYAHIIGKTCHPWIYISLDIDPTHVDVNVHPTKSEVRFLYQDEIIGGISEALGELISKSIEGKSFEKKNLTTHESFLYDSSNHNTSTPTDNNRSITPSSSNNNSFSSSAPWTQVRNDSREQSLYTYFNPNGTNGRDEDDDIEVVNEKKRERPDSESLNRENINRLENRTLSTPSKRISSHESQNKIKLTSVSELIKEFKSENHEGIQNVLKNHIFVGCVNTKLSLIQQGTKLYLCNMNSFTKELIYQEALHKFGEFEAIQLSSPLSIYTLCKLALESPESGWESTDGDPEVLSKSIAQNLIKKNEMLREYFMIDIDDDGMLKSLPEIICDYVPPIDTLASFILKLSTDVDWESEMSCFDSLCRELAEYYAIPDSSEDADEQTMWQIEHVFFPIMKTRFFPPRVFASDETIIQIASLEKLYKVFERC